jgi:hypothetical protein
MHSLIQMTPFVQRPKTSTDARRPLNSTGAITSPGFFARRMFPSRRSQWISHRASLPLNHIAVALVWLAVLFSRDAFAGPLDTWQTVTLSANAQKSANDMIFVNGEFWAACGTGKIQHSANGSAWTVVQTPATSHLTSITFANGRYVAVGYFFSILSSTDGATWTLHSQDLSNSNGAYQQVIYANGKFLAVGGKGQAQVSVDGVNWMPANMNFPDFYAEGVAFGNGTYVTVGDGASSGTNNVMTSPDGLVWTKRNPGVTTALESVAFGKGIFVATGWNNTILSSPDGITWTKRAVTLPSSGRFWSVAFTNGSFIAYGQGGRLFSSPDGITWAPHTPGSTAGISAVAYDGNNLLIFRELSGGARKSDVWPRVDGGTTPDQPNTPGGPNPSSSQIGNLSTRAWVGANDTQLISGFVINGTGAKKVLIRAVGPTLAAFGIQGALTDPQFRVVNSAGTEVTANNDWGSNPDQSALTTATSAVGAFALQAGSKDAATLVTLPPGAYNIVISGVGGGTGIALAEVYDADSQTACKLINIASRGFVGAGSDAAIPGFVVAGVAPRKLLIRGVGPTLGAFGVGGVIADPRITLFNSSQAKVSENDNWGSGDAAALTAAATQVGAFALNGGSADAAMIVTLQPGAYTVVVSGANDAMTGVGLVEVYEIP